MKTTMHGFDPSRLFLAFVGLVYVSLAFWCTILPEATAQAVGFELLSGSGQSEYYVVYGGLQLALGIAFLWPLWQPNDVGFALRLCFLIHTCLVAFRTASLLAVHEVGSTTYGLAAGEWTILIGTLLVWRLHSNSRSMAESS